MIPNIDCEECEYPAGMETVELFVDYNNTDHPLQGLCDECGTVYYFSMREVFRKTPEEQEADAREAV